MGVWWGVKFSTRKSMIKKIKWAPGELNSRHPARQAGVITTILGALFSLKSVLPIKSRLFSIELKIYHAIERILSVNIPLLQFQPKKMYVISSNYHSAI